MVEIKVVNRGHQQLPAYATPLSAGMDLRANLAQTLQDWFVYCFAPGL